VPKDESRYALIDQPRGGTCEAGTTRADRFILVVVVVVVVAVVQHMHLERYFG